MMKQGASSRWICRKISKKEKIGILSIVMYFYCDLYLEKREK